MVYNFLFHENMVKYKGVQVSTCIPFVISRKDGFMDNQTMEFMVFIVEITAESLFNNDKGAAYNSLIASGLWEIYVNNYDVTHTLGKECLLDEIKERLEAKAVPV